MSRKIYLLFYCIIFSSYGCNDDLFFGPDNPGQGPAPIDTEQEPLDTVQDSTDTELEPEIELDTCTTTGPVAIDNCIGEINYQKFCDSISNPNSDKYCDPYFIGEYFLSDVSRNICSQLCAMGEREYHYVNANGRTLSYKSEPRRYAFGYTYIYTNFLCDDDPSKTKLYCYHRDKFNVYYEALNGGYSFLIRLFPKPTPFIENPPHLQYDMLQILEFTGPQSSSTKLKVVTDALCANISESLSTIKFDTLTLNEKTYTDVYSGYPFTIFQSKYYFTLDKGVIAIEPENGNIYTLVE